MWGNIQGWFISLVLLGLLELAPPQSNLEEVFRRLTVAA